MEKGKFNLGQILDSFKATEQAESYDLFSKVSWELDKFKNQLREKIQTMTKDSIKEIINKLESEGGLTPEELEFIKLWMIGDAESYVKLENNFNDWLKEYRRLNKAISEFEGKDVDINNLLNLYGVVQDAIKLIPNISDFLEKKERIGKFNSATKDLEGIDREILVRVLKDKLQSPEA